MNSNISKPRDHLREDDYLTAEKAIEILKKFKPETRIYATWEGLCIPLDIGDIEEEKFKNGETYIELYTDQRP